MNCTCKRETVPANATPTTPYFPGIRRFAVEEVAEYSRECLQHGYVFEINLAADIRYGD